MRFKKDLDRNKICFYAKWTNVNFTRRYWIFKFNSGGSSGSSVNIEDSIWADLQRLQLQLRQFQTLSEGHMKETNDFQRVAKDDFQRLWDNVNELQEIANVTTKNMEDIYDKDILPLQNFKTATENDMNKLREEMDDFLSLKSTQDSDG